MSDVIDVKRLSNPPSNHFFGYYAVNPWDPAQQHHLALETDFHDHRPVVGDVANVGWVDRETGQFTRLAETAAFNLQQGSMMFWINVGHGDEFTFNDWQDGRLVSRALNPSTGKMRTIQGALAAVSEAGPVGVGLNFARMAFGRAVVGYASDLTADSVDPRPADDGLCLLDLKTGESKLIVSIADVIAANPCPEAREGLAWFNHVYINPTGQRVMFLCRIKRQRGWHSSMWTVNIDGSDLACQIEYGHWISHFAWIDQKRILVSTDAGGKKQSYEFVDGQWELAGGGGEPGFYTFTDRKGEFEPIGKDVLTGHAAIHPAGRWIVFDTSPSRKDHKREVALYDPQENRRVSIGRFYHEPKFVDDIRCDPHPRWSPDGRFVTFDSIHEGTRQIYIADVAQVVGA